MEEEEEEDETTDFRLDFLGDDNPNSGGLFPELRFDLQNLPSCLLGFMRKLHIF
jgi:hypothetical protein